MDDGIHVSVIYAQPEDQREVLLELAKGTTVADAVRLSGLLEKYPLEDTRLSCAIYGRLVTLTHVLEQGDRIEILRPLLVDPKEQRRRTAARNCSGSKTS
jgi:putative ubiquitin-RnfH superfamily antitoxin RatB of RatAB toxin-antitoxin module